MKKGKGILIVSIILSVLVLVALFFAGYMLYAEIDLLKQLETTENGWIGLGLIGILVVMLISSISGAILSLVIFVLNIIRVSKLKDKRATRVNYIFAFSAIFIIVVFAVLNIIFYALV